jgi:hypothetical protein
MAMTTMTKKALAHITVRQEIPLLALVAQSVARGRSSHAASWYGKIVSACSPVAHQTSSAAARSEC